MKRTATVESENDTRDRIIAVLSDVAPEIESESDVDADGILREQVDLDSMDFLNFMTGLVEQFEIEIPEKDYARLSTLNEIVNYFHERRNPSQQLKP